MAYCLTCVVAVRCRFDKPEVVSFIFLRNRSCHRRFGGGLNSPPPAGEPMETILVVLQLARSVRRMVGTVFWGPEWPEDRVGEGRFRVDFGKVIPAVLRGQTEKQTQQLHCDAYRQQTYTKRAKNKRCCYADLIFCSGDSFFVKSIEHFRKSNGFS